jgi:8-oxo-dGTP diphosphatase
MSETIRPYSMAVAPRLSRNNRFKNVHPRIDFPLERTVQWVAFSQRSPNERLMSRARLENSPTFVMVVAGAIRDENGLLLLQQALPNKRHAGQWEFPGGKLETAESPRFALCREVFEELGIELFEDAMEPAGFAEEAPSGGRAGLVLMLYTCDRWRGAPKAREGQAWGWFTSAQADRLDLARMDRALFARLAGP